MKKYIVDKNVEGYHPRQKPFPPIELIDEQDVTCDTDSTLLNTNRYVFLTDNMGERDIKDTIENEGNVGIFQRTFY